MNSSKKKIAINTLDILKTRIWENVNLSDIKKKSKVKSFDNIIKHKKDLLKIINQYFDYRLSLKKNKIEKSSEKDMIFEILMMRFDLLQNHRNGIISIFRSFRKQPKELIYLLPDILGSVEIMIGYIKVSPKGMVDKIMIKGVFIIYLSSFLTWIKDETTSLDKTMTALDNYLDKASEIIKFIK
tara:strand:+ start:4842 stop:5393 length:552 start_codon:yes stop_codon:yes gene_type:complete